jgi:hypothetical protein
MTATENKIKGFYKVCRIGDATFIKIEYKEGKLSISGVEGPMSNGNCRGGCGQIVMSGLSVNNYAPGWDADKVSVLATLWDMWHLNDMQAGTPIQTEFLKSHKAELKEYHKAGFDSYYSMACDLLEKAGLLVDNGYKYGTKWLKVEVPQDVLEWFQALPDADVNPIWV